MTRRTNRSVLYTDLIRWEPLRVPNSQGMAWIKTLSKDAETGARTALIKFDPGFKQKVSVSAWPMDTYVLEGEMTCGDRHYEKDTYHYRPAGVRYGPIETKLGITRIIFTANQKAKSSKDEIFIQDVKQMPWGKSSADLNDPRGLKDLRQDPVAGISFLLHASWAVGHRNIPGQMHSHGHEEEAYVLQGEWEDYLGDIEGHIHWRPGMYICRVPGDSWHGDTIALRPPKATLVRRGWVGASADKFYDTIQEHSPNVPIKPVDFLE